MTRLHWRITLLNVVVMVLLLRLSYDLDRLQDGLLRQTTRTAGGLPFIWSLTLFNLVEALAVIGLCWLVLLRGLRTPLAMALYLLIGLLLAISSALMFSLPELRTWGMPVDLTTGRLGVTSALVAAIGLVGLVTPRR